MRNSPGRLSESELEIYSRQIVLRDIGYEGQLRLKGARVAVVGLGGLGCPAALQLAAMGVGALRLIDRDVVELSNLHRQSLYTARDVGYPKVEVAARRLREINPHVEVEPLPLTVTPWTAEELVKGAEVVVDGLDSMNARYAVNRACVALKVPYVFGAAIEAFGNVSTILPGSTPCLECLMPNVSDAELPTCAIAGVHPAVLHVVAGIEVAEAVRLLVGETPTLAGSLLYCDLRSMAFDKVAIGRHEGCGVCGPNPRPKPRPPEGLMVEELCGRGGKRTHVVTPGRAGEVPLGRLLESLKGQSAAIKASGEHGVTFTLRPNLSLSVLRSGVMVVEGCQNSEEAEALYQRLVAKFLAPPGRGG